jgi:2-C-methyl-D-erythritol 4-phosphate cytidylyltransferase
VPLAGKPLVEWSIAAFRACEAVGPIVVACPPGNTRGLTGYDLGGVEGGGFTEVAGGATRSESVSNALAAVSTELVAIHDAARPLVTPELVEGVVSTLVADRKADGAIAATPVTDTIKRVAITEHADGMRPPFCISGMQKGGRVIESTLDRELLWTAQTPQVFRVEALRQALEAYPADAPPATDEAMLVEAMGGRVLIYPASPENLKVTAPLDLRVAELLLAGRGTQ